LTLFSQGSCSACLGPQAPGFAQHGSPPTPNLKPKALTCEAKRKVIIASAMRTTVVWLGDGCRQMGGRGGWAGEAQARWGDQRPPAHRQGWQARVPLRWHPASHTCGHEVSSPPPALPPPQSPRGTSGPRSPSGTAAGRRSAAAGRHRRVSDAQGGRIGRAAATPGQGPVAAAADREASSGSGAQACPAATLCSPRNPSP